MNTDEWSPAVIRKAESLIADGGLRRDEKNPSVWWVTGSGGGEYRVQTDGETWITCGCPNGQRQAGMHPHCYHTAAVLMQYLPDKGRLHVVKEES